MTDEKSSRRMGIVVLIAIALAIALILFLAGIRIVGGCPAGETGVEQSDGCIERWEWRFPGT